jgi:hypothetical protein
MAIAASHRPSRPAPTAKLKDHRSPPEWLLNALLAATLLAPLLISLYRLLG